MSVFKDKTLLITGGTGRFKKIPGFRYQGNPYFIT